MRILITMRLQGAWLWDNPVPDGVGGNSFDEPEFLLVRWEDRQEKYINQNGEESVSRAVVYVGQEIAVGAMLMKASNWADSSGIVPNDPTDSSVEAYPVKAYEELPTLKADGFLRTCYL